MGFRINTNVAAMNSHMYSERTNKELDKSLTALSSGLRINSAADDASGLSIANSLRQQAQGLGQAINNANDGIGIVQSADGALDEYTKIIDTIRTKSIQAASDGQTLDTRQAIQADIDRLTEEAQNIAATTSFNGQTLLNGGYENKSFQIGAYSGQTVNININDSQTDKVGKFALSDGTTTVTTAGGSTLTLSISTEDGVAVTAAITTTTGNTSLQNAQALVDAFNAAAQQGTNSAGETVQAGVRASVIETTAGSGNYTVRLDSAKDFDVTSDAGTGLANATANLDNALSTIDVTTRAGAQKAIITSDYSLRDIDKTRSDIGSVQNQLESTVRNISVTQVNVTSAESQIRDVDFAAESANFNKQNLLAQSGSYAMSQANSVQQNVMRLLQ
jgi:flagellin